MRRTLTGFSRARRAKKKTYLTTERAGGGVRVSGSETRGNSPA